MHSGVIWRPERALGRFKFITNHRWKWWMRAPQTLYSSTKYLLNTRQTCLLFSRSLQANKITSGSGNCCEDKETEWSLEWLGMWLWSRHSYWGLSHRKVAVQVTDKGPRVGRNHARRGHRPGGRNNHPVIQEYEEPCLEGCKQKRG